MTAALDFIMNGAAHGDVASMLMQNGGDPNALRPWLGEDGNVYTAVWNRQTKKFEAIRTNVNATLRKDDWIQLDRVVIKAAKPRLKLVADLNAQGLTYSIPNGMAKTVLQHETQSDVSEAEVSMDGMKETENDRPVWELNNLPLPIIHKDFGFSIRQVMASRNGESALDTTMAELCGRRVAEEAEKFALGTRATYKYGGGTIYGITNFPSRMTRTIADPAGGGWTPADTVDDVLAMIQQSVDAFHYGPWMLYHSTGWNRYMDNDYSAAKGDNTLRQRLMMIEDIRGVRSLDYLTGTQLLLVQLTPDVIRMVNGMSVTTVQWDTHGGLYKRFKVMAIMVPQLRTDMNDTTGIVHGNIA